MQWNRRSVFATVLLTLLVFASAAVYATRAWLVWWAKEISYYSKAQVAEAAASGALLDQLASREATSLDCYQFQGYGIRTAEMHDYASWNSFPSAASSVRAEYLQAFKKLADSQRELAAAMCKHDNSRLANYERALEEANRLRAQAHNDMQALLEGYLIPCTDTDLCDD